MAAPHPAPEGADGEGPTEKDLRQLARDHPNLEVYCFRPDGILASHTNPVFRAVLSPIAVDVDQLVTALIRVAGKDRAPRSAVIHNAEIRKLAGAEPVAREPH